MHTPSTNPNKAPALNIYDTLRRPKTFIQGQRRTRSQVNYVFLRKNLKFLVFIFFLRDVFCYKFYSFLPVV